MAKKKQIEASTDVPDQVIKFAGEDALKLLDDDIKRLKDIAVDVSLIEGGITDNLRNETYQALNHAGVMLGRLKTKI